MKIKMLSIVALGVSIGFGQAAVEERHRTEKSFPMTAGARRLIVDGVNDQIEVTGYNGNDVQVVVDERWRADSAEFLAEAKRDIRLDMSEQGGIVKLYVDGPFRNRNGYRNHGEQHYRVSFDFQVKVPMDAFLELRTVNGGSIKVNGSDGDFDIHNVNGGIEMRDLTGSGFVQTVNGGIKVGFRQNPRKECSFKSVNGAIDAEFQPALSADMQMKTFNGQMFTDFEVSTLPSVIPAGEVEGRKHIYRSDRFTRVRAGSGGPEFKFETLNGTIRIIKK